MEIRVLRYFLMVAEQHSITGAAKLLHLTQPTLSRQLQDLEEELGQMLFVRKYHRVDLTEKGMLLRKRAEEILDLVNKTGKDMRANGGNVSGEVFLGAGESRNSYNVARVMRDVQTTHPGVRFRLHSGMAIDVLERLDKGTLDFGLIINPDKRVRETYDYIDLPMSEAWGILMRKDSPLSALRNFTAADLDGVPLIVPVRQSVREQSGERGFPAWCGDAFESLRVVATYDLLHNATQLVEAGVGYAVTLRPPAHDRLLCFRPLKPELRAASCIVWKKRQIFTPAAAFFLATLRKAFPPQKNSLSRVPVNSENRES